MIKIRCEALLEGFAVRCLLNRVLMGVVVLPVLAACSGLEQSPEHGRDGVAENGASVAAGFDHEAAIAHFFQTPEGGGPWRPFLLPGKRFATFQIVSDGGAPALTVQSDNSVSILRRRFPQGLTSPGELGFAWKVDALPLDADLSESGGEDAAVRVLLSFDGDYSKWSPRNHRLSELSRLLTGEPMPYATLMYIWSNRGDVESIVIHPRTDSIRKVVVESGAAHVGQWRYYQRDIRRDFVKAFGEEPGPLMTIAIMTDTDNTHSRLKAWYGPMTLSKR